MNETKPGIPGINKVVTSMAAVFCGKGAICSSNSSRNSGSNILSSSSRSSSGGGYGSLNDPLGRATCCFGL